MAAIVQSSWDAIIGKNLDGIIVSWNPSAERLFGYTANEAIGQMITLIIPDDHQAEFAEIMARLRRGESITQRATVRVHKDGRLIPVSLSISPVHDVTGRIVGASKVSRDLTESLVIQNQVITSIIGNQLAALIEVETALRQAQAEADEANRRMEELHAALALSEAGDRPPQGEN